MRGSHAHRMGNYRKKLSSYQRKLCVVVSFGPFLPFTDRSRCCDRSPHCRHSLQLLDFDGAGRLQSGQNGLLRVQRMRVQKDEKAVPLRRIEISATQRISPFRSFNYIDLSRSRTVHSLRSASIVETRTKQSIGRPLFVNERRTCSAAASMASLSGIPCCFTLLHQQQPTPMPWKSISPRRGRHSCA
jgi:hypothetical protein